MPNEVQQQALENHQSGGMLSQAALPKQKLKNGRSRGYGMLHRRLGSGYVDYISREASFG